MKVVKQDTSKECIIAIGSEAEDHLHLVPGVLDFCRWQTLVLPGSCRWKYFMAGVRNWEYWVNFTRGGGNGRNMSHMAAGGLLGNFC